MTLSHVLVLSFFAVATLRAGIPMAAQPPLRPGQLDTAIALNPRELLPALLRRADHAVITYDDLKKRTKADTHDRKWLDRLADLLGSASYEPRPHCFCVSNPVVRVFDGDKLLATLSAHHDEKLRVFCGDSGGDFLVGDKVGRAFREAALEKRTLVPPSLPKFTPPQKVDIPLEQFDFTAHQ